jgi:hypothetical protein
MKNKPVRNVIFVAVCAFAFAATAAAQQYKWVDKDGRVLYGDIPPAGVKATPLRAPSAPNAAPAARDARGAKDPTSPAEQEAAFRKRLQERQEAEEKAAKERADAEAKRLNCEQAQASLRTLQSGERIAVTNPAGEREFINDAQRAAETQRVQRAMKEWCS